MFHFVRPQSSRPSFWPNNPRLIEDGIHYPTESQVIKALADNANLSELVESIASNGYIDIEPLIVQRIGSRYVVLEGNRRLAAIRILQNHDLAKGTGLTPPKVDPQILETLKKVTVYAIANPDEAREFHRL